jgi:hypothetical protein
MKLADAEPAHILADSAVRINISPMPISTEALVFCMAMNVVQ